MITEHFYYRKYDSPTFIESRAGNFSIDPVFILIRCRDNEQTCFCPIHRKWEEVKKIGRHKVITNCGHQLNGLPEKYPERLGYSWKINIMNSLWNEVTINGHKFIDTQKRTLSRSKKIDTKCNSDDKLDLLFALRVIIDDEKFTFSIEEINLDIKKLHDHNFYNNLPLERGYARFNINKFDYKYNCYKRIPVTIESKVRKHFEGIIEKWAGKKLTFNTNLKGYDFFEAATEYPFEPNITLFVNKYYYLFGEDFNFELLKTDSNCFNKICDALYIRPYRTLRKLFVNNPDILYLYYIINQSGFVDKNIKNSILTSDENTIFYDENCADAIIQFSREYLKNKSELSLWNMIKKTCTEDFFYDTIKMFGEYSNFIPEEVKNKIFKDGITKYNHDVLSKVVTDIKYRNIEFSYSDKEKMLEDEISGITFKLPKDTDTLREIGCALHNCVASYKNRIIGKECTIIYGEENDKPVLCIEICDNKIYQQKMDYNQEPEGLYKEVMEKYKKKHRLE